MWLGQLILPQRNRKHCGFHISDIQCALAINDKCRECGVPLQNPSVEPLRCLVHPCESPVEKKPHQKVRLFLC